MQPFTDIDATSTAVVRPYLGSFWNSRFGEQDKLNILLGMATSTKLLGSFRRIAANLSGDMALASFEKYVDEPFNPGSVFQSGQLLYDDPDVLAHFAETTAVDQYYNHSSIQYFVLPLGQFIPMQLNGPSSKLVLGIDFFVVADNWLFFRQDPRVLFPDSMLRMVLAERIEPKSVNAFLLRANAPDNERYITRYYRQRTDPRTLALAAAAAGGITIIHYDQKLVGSWKSASETIYVFEYETLRVGYDHNPLVVGRTYYADTLIGDGIQVYYNDGSKADWWRQVPWGAGLLLDPIVKQQAGLPLLNADTIAYSAGSDNGSVDGSKLHARLKLSNDFYAEQPYWDFVASRETESGFYLNNLLGLPEDEAASQQLIGYNYSTSPVLTVTTEDLGAVGDTISTYLDYGSIGDSAVAAEDFGTLYADFTGAASTPIYSTLSGTFARLLEQYAIANAQNTQLGWPIEQPDLESLPNIKRVNALDTFFSATLRQRGLVVFVRYERIPKLNEFYSFLHREMIVGVIPIIFGAGPTLKVENVEVGNTIMVDDSAVRLSASTPLNLMEHVELSDIMTDTVVFE